MSDDNYDDGYSGMGRNHISDFGQLNFPRNSDSDGEGGGGGDSSYGGQHGYSASHHDGGNDGGLYSEALNYDHFDNNEPLNHAQGQGLFGDDKLTIPGEGASLDGVLSNDGLDSIGLIKSINNSGSLNKNVTDIDGNLTAKISHEGYAFKGIAAQLSLENLPTQLTAANKLGGLSSGAEGQSAEQTALYSRGS